MDEETNTGLFVCCILKISILTALLYKLIFKFLPIKNISSKLLLFFANWPTSILHQLIRFKFPKQKYSSSQDNASKNIFFIWFEF